MADGRAVSGDGRLDPCQRSRRTARIHDRRRSAPRSSAVALPSDGRLDVLVDGVRYRSAVALHRRQRRSAVDRRSAAKRAGARSARRSATSTTRRWALRRSPHSVAGYFGDADISRSPLGGRSGVHPVAAPARRRRREACRCRAAARWARWRHVRALSTSPPQPASSSPPSMPAASASRPTILLPQMWLQAVLAVPGGATAPDDLADELTEHARAAPAGTTPTRGDRPAAERVDDARPARPVGRSHLRRSGDEHDVDVPAGGNRGVLVATARARRRARRGVRRRRRRCRARTTCRTPIPATASSSTWPSAARRSPC